MLRKKEQANLKIPILIALALALSVSAFFSYVSVPTAMAASSFNVNVSEKFDGKITVFSFNDSISIMDREKIVLEFTNFGSIPFDSQSSVIVYYFNKSKLEERADFEDYSVKLNAGSRRRFVNEFIPTEDGEFYIKAKVAYGLKRSVVWGFFRVYIPSSNQSVTNETVIVIPNYIPGPPGGSTQTVVSVPVTPAMALQYNSTFDMMAGDSVLLPVNVINSGSATLTDIRFYTSNSEMIDVDVNPKVVSSLQAGDNYMFLLTVSALRNVTPGRYNISFNVLSRDISANGTIEANIIQRPSVITYDKEALREKILGYRYIISELEAKIDYYYSYGSDVADANATVQEAITRLNEAQAYFNDGEYGKCMVTLEMMQPLLEQASLKVGNISLKLYAAKPSFPYIIILVIAIAIAIFAYYEYNKNKVRKPKFLAKQESSE